MVEAIDGSKLLFNKRGKIQDKDDTSARLSNTFFTYIPKGIPIIRFNMIKRANKQLIEINIAIIIVTSGKKPKYKE